MSHIYKNNNGKMEDRVSAYRFDQVGRTYIGWWTG